MNANYPDSLALREVLNRPERKILPPSDQHGNPLKMSDYFGEYVFTIQRAEGVSKELKKELLEVIHEGRPLSKKLAETVAQALLKWACSKGVTHFCHWFQPLTGGTAEKHDSFLSFDTDGETAIEYLSASQLIQGEPDASSFPHGGSRSTFEARGYTSWDLTSPIFIIEGTNGKTLCIPCGFVSYHGEALDTKTPLLRALNAFSPQATTFLKLLGEHQVKEVQVTVGAEQEYFLVDKEFYFRRPDLVMTGRSLFGALPPKNQQLEDHYFGAIEDRVLSFMQELEVELYKIGIPAKTRHNEVAPGQYELAQIFREANISVDNNQMVMAILKRVALKHHFVALLHEKPFIGVNGSGKHLNWSMADQTGRNLLSTGDTPLEHYRFLAVVAMILEAVCRHSGLLRACISGHGNDFRLGANEAPPSIISVFLGDTLTSLLQDVVNGKEPVVGQEKSFLKMGAHQLAQLFQDNTDRNRTSPFAFTGNKFEFRAVGSSVSTGFPTTILVGALTEIFDESNRFMEEEFKKGTGKEDVLKKLITKWYKKSSHIVFNGDGYSADWVKEAHKRGLPNYRTTPEALKVFKDESQTQFLARYDILSNRELETRYNVLVERYLKMAEIEWNTLKGMLDQTIFPAIMKYKQELLGLILSQKSLGHDDSLETAYLKKLQLMATKLKGYQEQLEEFTEKMPHHDHQKAIDWVAQHMMPVIQQMAGVLASVESLIPDAHRSWPNYQDMLFIR
jgi:glutamine synthetase